jgi:heme exporter protein CcmD
MTDFFAMGGYAAFVWPAYAATFAGLGAAIVLTWRAYRAAQKRLDHLGTDPS